MRHAGLGFPNGPTAAWDLYLQGDRPLLMLESEYRWHADQALEGGRTVLFRAMPGAPASFGWNVADYAERVMQNVPAGATDLVFANEGDLNYERGDREDDWDGAAWPGRYRTWATFMTLVAHRLRGVWGWEGRLHWPAWAPDHGIRETVDVWRDAAAEFDVIDFHAYEDAATIEDEYRWFRATFPGKPLWLTEWNVRGGQDVGEDRRVLETLARLCAEDHQLHCFYFIGRWFPPAEGWHAAFDVEGRNDRLALFMAPPVADVAPAPPAPADPEPEPIVMTEYEQFCRDEAARRGIDPDTAVTVANSEGSLTEPSRVGDFSGPPWYSGKSWWAFQLHYGGTGYEDWGGSAGMGNSFTALTGWAPGDPAAWRDAMRYALDRVRTSGWGAWYGAAARGIHGFDGVDSSVPWDETPADEWDYRQQPPSTGAVTYDPTTPPERQISDWACSIRSATWLLKSLGVATDAGQMQNEFVPDYVTPAAGLLLGSGVGLAEVIQRHLPDGLMARVIPHVAWDDLMAMAGRGPVAMGSGSLYHWIAVADVIDAETLSAPNPAPNYHGLGDRLTHQQFDTWAPWNAVWVEVVTAEPNHEAGGEDLSAAERTELDDLRRTRDGWINAIAYLGDDVSARVAKLPETAKKWKTERDAIVKEMARVREEMVGAKP